MESGTRFGTSSRRTVPMQRIDLVLSVGARDVFEVDRLTVQ